MSTVMFNPSLYNRRNISFFLIPPAPSAQDGIQDAMASLFPCAGQTFGTDPDLRYFGDPVSGMYMEHYYGSQDEQSPTADEVAKEALEASTPHKFDPELFKSVIQNITGAYGPPADWETCLAREIIVIPDVESDGWIVTLMATSMNKSVIYAKIEMIGLGGVSELTQAQQHLLHQHFTQRTMGSTVDPSVKQPRPRRLPPVAKITQDPGMGTLVPIALAAFAGYLLARRGAARNNLI